jgi:hypothetical protein
MHHGCEENRCKRWRIADSLVARLWRNAWAATDGLAGLSPWQVDRLTCETVFERLVREGFLYKRDGGAYTAQSPLRK